MVIRITPIVVCALALSSVAVARGEDDPIRQTLSDARAAYEKSAEALREQVIEDLEKQDRATRRSKRIDRQRLDLIKAQRDQFEETGQIPGLLDRKIAAKVLDARETMRKAFEAAIDAYLRKSLDEEAEAVEGELAAFRTSFQTSRGIELLSMLDTTRHTAAGRWVRDGTSIHSVAGQLDAIRIPQAIPAEYDLEIEAERFEGNNDLLIAIVAGPSRPIIVLDGWGGRISGLSLVDGRLADRNETTFRGEVFRLGEPAKLVVAVRRGRIRVTADGRPVIDWTGDESSLSMAPGPWGRRPGLFLAAQKGGSYRITSLRLKPLVVDDTLQP